MKNKLFLSVLLVLCFITAETTLLAQEISGKTFTVRNANGSDDNLETYRKAIESGDFTCYRFKTKTRTLTFDSGVELELFPVAGLLKQGIKISSGCSLEDNNIPAEIILSLHPSGIIIIQTKSESKSTVKTQEK